jgi:endonuclease YncB( thermonuclease family)
LAAFLSTSHVRKDTWESVMGGWRRTAFAALALCASCSPPEQKQPAAPEPSEADSAIVSEIVGVATISDGDTIRIGERRIRFDGVQTPRPRATCGETNVHRAATDALRSVIRSNEVRCSISDLPSDGQDVARCRVGETDLGEYMISNGWARDVVAESNGAYADEEAAAREARRGVWGLTCATDPWPAE